MPVTSLREIGNSRASRKDAGVTSATSIRRAHPLS
jgi:hypothetical protein